MQEKVLVRKILQYLNSLPNCFAWKSWGGMYSVAGIPDVICCYFGYFIAFEVKVGKNKPTKLQEKTIDQIKNAGGKAYVVYSLDEVKKIMNEVVSNDKKRTKKV